MTSVVGTSSRSKQRRRTGASKTRRAPTREPPRVYIVSPSGHTLPQVHGVRTTAMCRIRTKQALLKEFRTANRQAVWVAPDSDALTPLATESPTARGEQRLLVLDRMKEVTHHLFSALFRYVVTASDRLQFLGFDELVEVLASPDRNDLFIGGAVDKERGAVLLYRGNVEPLVVPLAWFTNSSSKAVANPDALEVTDFGQTVRLGAFEAAADAILYEFDAAYRRAAKKRALDRDPSLGAAVRRLRLQKGLTRRDFAGVTEKTIARIERNEIVRPHTRTLEAIASTFGVTVDELRSY